MMNISFRKCCKCFLVVVFGLLSSPGQGCRDVNFNFIGKNKRLANHTLRTIKPMKDDELCMRKCFLEPLCSSVNFCEKSGEEASCELIDTDQTRAGGELNDTMGCSFFSSKTHCSSNPCVNNATCSGDYSSDPVPYKCFCPKGFEGKHCEKDIDECATGKHDCHVNALCNNTIGRYNCTCKNGFHGDGKTCEDINECTTNKHNCFSWDICNNLPGTFNCSCRTAVSWKVLFDFENGKQGWTLTGTAFNNQPTYGDNPTARNSETANLKGNWWIGGAENRPSPSDPAGNVQLDGPTGTMTSPPFVTRGSTMRFLIGGGCDKSTIFAELLIGGQSIHNETGSCGETMTARYWSVEDYIGQQAQVRLADLTSGGWGHINFDHLEGHFC